jgi:L-lactate utilization protein LutC
MPSSVLHKASELPPDIRQAVGRLLGRPLEPEEHVSVMAYRPHKAPNGAARTELADRLKERIDKTAARVKDIPEAELDELIDEAVDHIRHHRP